MPRCPRKYIAVACLFSAENGAEFSTGRVKINAFWSTRLLYVITKRHCNNKRKTVYYYENNIWGDWVITLPMMYVGGDGMWFYYETKKFHPQMNDDLTSI